jgi:NAD(P)-dependent dehydrogenase (short-subunit alcohol dehydrogenase family)
VLLLPINLIVEGIGRLLALSFAKEGSKAIVIWDINEDAMQSVAREVNQLGVRCFTYSCDIRCATCSDFPLC